MFLSSSTCVAAGGAVYFQTNNLTGNAIVVHSIQSDGTVKFSSVVQTGGNGGTRTPGASDGLFSQDSVVVGGGCLFVVNAGSSSISTFQIQPDQPTNITLLNTVPSGGDFPIAVAYSGPKSLLCALNGGANNGVQCFTVGDLGLLALPASTYQPLGVTETTPPSGPKGSLSDIIFNTDGSLLFVSGKGFNATNPGFIATYTVTGVGATATLSLVAKSWPTGSVLPFSLTLLPGTDTIVYTDPSNGYGVASYAANGALSSSAFYSIPSQGANCWSAYSPSTMHVYLSDPGKKVINEVSINGTTSTLVKQYPTGGSIDIAVAGQYLYALLPGLTGIEVFLISGSGNAVSIQTYATSAYTQAGTLTPTVQGIAVYISVVGAVYASTNSLAGNSVVVHAIHADGTVSFASLIPTGGMGGASKAGAVDGLFSQDSVVVGGGCLFVVNAGSSSISTFQIQPDQPTNITLLNTVPSGGDFPIAVAYSGPKSLLCALNGGANNGVQCFTVGDLGLLALPASTYQPLGVTETTPPSGPKGSLSDIIFNTDGSLLFVSGKGFNATNPGFIATYTVTGVGATATLSLVAKSWPTGSVLPFSLTLLPGTDTIVYTDPSNGYGVASYAANGALSSSAFYSIPSQGANCWSAYSPSTMHVYLSDPGKKVINEVSINGTTSTLVKQYPTGGSIDIAVAGQYLYALLPGLTGIEVFAVASPINARSIQTYPTSAYAQVTSTIQGLAVFLVTVTSGSCQPTPTPKEICSTRLLSNPASMLRITLPAGVTLTTLTYWNDAPGGPPLLQTSAQLAGLSISIGSNDTLSGCAIRPSATPTAWTPTPPPSGVYGAWDLVCGSVGSLVVVSFPAVQLAPQPPSSIAVKVCARTDGGGDGDASLLIQKV